MGNEYNNQRGQQSHQEKNPADTRAKTGVQGTDNKNRNMPGNKMQGDQIRRDQKSGSGKTGEGFGGNK